MADRTDTDATIEIAQAAIPRDPIVIGGPVETPFVAVAVPPGWTMTTFDTEKWASAPRLASGTIRVHDALGFSRAVRQRAAVDEVVLYANEDDRNLVAILNDDAVDDGEQIADWRDYRVELQLRERPEWKHWKSLDGEYVDQERFAEHIEHGLPELVSPPAADALEIAQTFNATIAARFKSGTRLRDGSTQFQYEEDIEASAGLLTIPQQLVLNVAPFFGSPAVTVTARFRFRLKSGGLTLGYLLDRPDDVERAAFNDIVTAVAADLDRDPIAGVAPAARAS